MVDARVTGIPGSKTEPLSSPHQVPLTSAASCALVSAPPCTSRCTTSILPDMQAECSGVWSKAFLANSMKPWREVRRPG